MRRIVQIAFILLFALIITACQSAPEPTTTPTPTHTHTPTPEPTPTITNTPRPAATAIPMPRTAALNPADQAYVRVVNGHPDHEQITVYVEGLSIASNLIYRRFTQQTGIEAGEYIVRVVPPGMPNNDENAIVTKTLNVSGGEALILVFTGTTNTPAIATMSEDISPLDTRQARVSAVHAATGAPAFTLRLNEEDLSGVVAFGEQSEAVTLPERGIALILTSSTGSRLAAESLDVRGRNHYTLVAINDPASDTGVSVLTLSNRVPGRATLRAVNVSPDSGPVDVYLNGGNFATGLEFGRTNQRLTLPTDQYTATVFTTGADPINDQPLASTLINLNPDDDATLIISGPLENLSITRHRDDLSPTPVDGARVAFAHALRGGPSARVITDLEMLPDVPILAYRDNDSGVIVRADVYNFLWSVPNEQEDDIVEAASNVQLEPGINYLYLLTGRDPDEPAVIISERTGIDESLPSVSLDDVDAEPSEPVRVRFINALVDGTPIEYEYNDNPVTRALGYGDQQGPIIIPSGVGTITARFASDASPFLDISYNFISGTDYTIYLYGLNPIDGNMLVASLPQFLEDNVYATLRLVNVSPSSGVSMGLGYTEFWGLPTEQPTPEPPPAEPADPDIAETEEPTGTRYRRGLSFGITRPIRDIPPGSVSAPTTAPEGQFNIHVVDQQVLMIAETLYNLTLEPGAHYDIIAYEDVTTTRVTAFVVRYDP